MSHGGVTWTNAPKIILHEVPLARTQFGGPFDLNWDRFGVKTLYGWRGAKSNEPGAIPEYWLRSWEDPEPRREVFCITDPIALSFDPMKPSDERMKGEATFKSVWRDPLARTYWLALKGKFITSQYFRGDCHRCARQVRRRPPQTPEEVPLPDSIFGFSGFWSGDAMPVRVALWPWIVRVLVDEKRWPYLPPPCAPHALRWVAKPMEGGDA